MNELSLFNTLFGDSSDDDSESTGLIPSIFGVCGLNGWAEPKVDVKETDKDYSIVMDLPGRTEKDVSVDIDEGILTVKSVKEETTETKSDDKESTDKKDTGKWIIKERKSSSFERKFSLPKNVDIDSVNASFKNGVLSISVPKTDKAVTAKKIEISNE